MPVEMEIEVNTAAAEARLKKLTAELKEVESKTEVAKSYLERVRVDGKTFTQFWNEVSAFRNRVVKFSDLDALEAKLADFEKRIKALEKK